MHEILFSKTSKELPDRAAAIDAAKKVSSERRHAVRVVRDDDNEHLIFRNGSLHESWISAGRGRR
jgi:hypothetical protein